MPQRIQLSRQRGYRKPEGAVVVSRPSYWANPFRIGATVLSVLETNSQLWDFGGLRELDDDYRLTRQDAVDAFGRWVRLSVGESGWTRAYEASVRLRGKDLACWCPLDAACHADTLLELANAQRWTSGRTEGQALPSSASISLSHSAHTSSDQV